MLYPCLSMLIYGLSMVCAVSEEQLVSSARTPMSRNTTICASIATATMGSGVAG